MRPTDDAPLDIWSHDRGPTPRRWTILLHATSLEVRHADGTLTLDGSDVPRIRIKHRFLRGTTITIEPGPGAAEQIHLAATSRREGRRLAGALDTLRTRHGAASALDALTAWHAHVEDTLKASRRDLRWITSETTRTLLESRPEVGDTLQHLMVPPLWTALRPHERAAVQASPTRVLDQIQAANDDIVTTALREHRRFFDTIEKTPLTEEQARAVITLDGRVHVIAAAGSGKTSVMVARAAYAVWRGFNTPDQILLLAFNKDAATELETRVRERFTAAGIDPAGIRATTFHAFGLDVIGQATGQRPSVAPWVADSRESEQLADIVTELRTSDPDFALSWDLFRLLYARLSDDWTEELPADGWDPATRTAGLRTYAGDVVKSQGERLIADWLYLNHVRYEYERPYAHNTATRDRRQYVPDFYYPDARDGAGAWHEHWGVDANGNPPPTWTGYRESMRWKQQLHRTHETDLIETTWAGIMDRSDFTHLATELDKRGVSRTWDPDRAPVGAAPFKDADLLRLVRTFMVHVKSNSLTRHTVAERVREGRVKNVHRADLFLSLYWPIHDAWQARLDQGGYVDFEDMLVNAARHVEAGDWSSPYTHVLADEFQDVSQARARLIRALVVPRGRHLLAVGDDWQGINRFAGADLNVLTHFGDYFGPGPTLRLSTTFRSHQRIVEVASAFIAKNPAQLAKTVTSIRGHGPAAAPFEGVTLRQAATAREVPATISSFLDDLAAAIREDRIAPRDGGPVTVDVLGRYRHDQQLMPSRTPAGLRVSYRTIHSAKGLEADYVVVANLGAGTYGFPSQISDDPVLNLAMVTPDAYRHAEERRLLYVALTRARHGVVLVAPAEVPSEFVTELLADDAFHRSGADASGAGRGPQVCPSCRRGVMRQVRGPRGPFLGCSTFPACLHTASLDGPRF